MANRDNPHGCIFVGMDGPGNPWHQQFNKVAAYGTALYQGDAVARVAGSATANFLGAVEIPGTPGTTAITGVNSNHGAASTLTQHTVNVSSNSLYEAQDNKDTDGLVAADLGLNCNLEYNSGSATTLQSGHELDESTANVSASRDVHLVEFLLTPDNDPLGGGWQRVVFKINLHRYAGAGVVGV